MIPPNPDTALLTDRHGYPTREAVRAAAFHSYGEALRLRYLPDEVLDAAADAIHALLPTPGEGDPPYDEVLYERDDFRDRALFAEDELSKAEETIYALRNELAEAQEEADDLRDRVAELAQKAHTNDFY